MNLSSRNFKLIIGAFYLLVLFVGLYLLFSTVNFKDLTSYDFIKSNKDTIIHYKNENFFLLTISFFIFCIFWTLFLGFATPLLLFSGFIFGKWWGVSIVLLSTSIGAVLLYILAGIFFRQFIEEKLAPKFSNLKEHFNKNEIIYFMFFRFIGGGGTPYPVQNILPILFNMKIKNYFLATIAGSFPSMFVSVSLGSGIEKVIDQNDKLNFFTVVSSPDIYLPIFGFIIIIFITIILKKFFFK